MGLRDTCEDRLLARGSAGLGRHRSALALAIAVDALGAGQVTAYNLPSQCNTDATRSIGAAPRRPSAFAGIIPISSTPRFNARSNSMRTPSPAA